MKRVVLLFALPLLVLGCAKGWGGGEFFSYSESDADGPVDATAFAGGAPRALGKGRRTARDRAWIAYMNRQCRRRNARITALPHPKDSLEMKVYADDVLDVMRDYRRRANARAVPASYAPEAQWVADVDAAAEEAVQDVFFAADDAEAAVGALEQILADTRPGLIQIGLGECVGLR